MSKQTPKKTRLIDSILKDPTYFTNPEQHKEFIRQYNELKRENNDRTSFPLSDLPYSIRQDYLTGQREWEGDMWKGFNLEEYEKIKAKANAKAKAKAEAEAKDEAEAKATAEAAAEPIEIHNLYPERKDLTEASIQRNPHYRAKLLGQFKPRADPRKKVEKGGTRRRKHKKTTCRSHRSRSHRSRHCRSRCSRRHR